MKRVTGIGGVFFKSDDPERLYAWYEEHLGLTRSSGEAVVFKWRQADDGTEGQTVLAIFPRGTDYFHPSRSQFMLNFCVDDLDGLLTALRAEGVEVEEKIEQYDYGRFAWIRDPEGNRIELWEPTK